MSILKVARMGHPVLRAKARTVDKSELKSATVQQFIDSMIDTMYEYRASAWPRRRCTRACACSWRCSTPTAAAKAMRSPSSIPRSSSIGDQTVEGWEGCLSIPDVRGRVPRAQHIKVSALDRNGKRFELELKDFPARVVQHETDHLDGVLFLDRMRAFESLTYLEEYSRYHTRRDDDDEDDDDDE